MKDEEKAEEQKKEKLRKKRMKKKEKKKQQKLTQEAEEEKTQPIANKDEKKLKEKSPLINGTSQQFKEDTAWIQKQTVSSGKQNNVKNGHLTEAHPNQSHILKPTETGPHQNFTEKSNEKQQSIQKVEQTRENNAQQTSNKREQANTESKRTIDEPRHKNSKNPGKQAKENTQVSQGEESRNKQIKQIFESGSQFNRTSSLASTKTSDWEDVQNSNISTQKVKFPDSSSNQENKIAEDKEQELLRAMGWSEDRSRLEQERKFVKKV